MTVIKDEGGADDVRGYISSIEEVIEDARNGRMVVLVDDEDRENEGDLVIPAEMVTPEVINFMAKYGRGLICLTLTGERVEELNLPLMTQRNASRHHTNFTLSIEARDGVTTGISAADRAHTVQVAIDPAKGARDVVTPGHIFPLRARDGGVLVRAGHTEAAVDIARLAGMNPSGVICEIMNDDGTMARMPDLVPFAQLHGLKIGTIADLIAYRRRTEKLVERLTDGLFRSHFGGEWRMIVYASKIDGSEHMALVKGDLAAAGDQSVLVRMHVVNAFDDLLGDRSSGRAGAVRAAMEQIDRAGRGVLVLLREPRPTGLSDLARARLESPQAASTLRDYGTGAQILLDLGVRNMILLSNSRQTVVGLDGYGLHITGHAPLIIEKV
ncbi:MAG: 3,4-dihydroxy-2-butanone-4-phosphate synthase [Tistrella sp.]|jgi:3,4-dihydroxy 2-butanone 4-phosphate synthase/GTP cyclohydrolase II|uniref:3,4-dihydroxy-2-butanone 4-phosphate synthase n=2 Tax=Tistrella mobilis TaxID=171437 RepID=I3TLM2_TISMK|nr:MULTISPECIES: 3,4-dihydroxy-2-butanone-4-phosphate synthase [Tistrella]AFK53660.1 GTP cyclohydrolase II [Tistrella mobilis KA081020-065]KYO51950.1 3,4-dihydroxy-2-butanone 4-phosphate synthase [Tistrella mobilis]MAD35707.1 3,4-dihydroxy-2-butanone-4-phosphate synthase [Tistrella sp.]MBA79395.1 3,4-dihydroxy-2-butanone-4-phosphate synthase [Tistrella sp.]HAE49672.1 3,4-dihydroxy-2-butanone-4-phosphate synthase [Tistrella mobilis]